MCPPNFGAQRTALTLTQHPVNKHCCWHGNGLVTLKLVLNQPARLVRSPELARSQSKIFYEVKDVCEVAKKHMENW